MVFITNILKSIKLVAVILFLPSLFFAQTKAKDGRDFPEPTSKEFKNLMFYVQRTNNINTLMYEFNYNSDGEINSKEPVKVYWKNYNTDNTSEPLNSLQRKYAYGVESHVLDSVKKTYYFNFVSYKKKSIFLIKNQITKKYEAFITLNNKLIEITRIYIHIEGGAFWTPKIKYINVYGKLPNNKNEEVVEKVIP